MKKHVFFYLAAAVFLAAEISTAADTGTGGAIIARHEFRIPYSDRVASLTISASIQGRDIVFKKEPDFQNHEIVRGAIPVGDDKKDHLCFAWDVTAKKLHVDLNRNLDLTDDAEGVFECQHYNQNSQDFVGIRFESRRTPTAVPYILRMSFFKGGRPPSCTVWITSGWYGELELYGKKWLVTVVDNMDGSLGQGDIFILLPPRELPGVWAGRSFLERLNVPERLFLDGHHYELAFGFEPGIDGPRLIASFTETQPPMAQLTIGGNNIQRLTLFSDRWENPTIILDSPEGDISAPAGEYNRQRVILDRGGKDGLLRAELYEKISLDADKPKTLKIGGPLNNTVKAGRKGSSLQLNYLLIGVGGEQYTWLKNPATPPTFTIFNGNKKIVSDSFKYG